MSILYSITKALTFPGAYLKAFFEHLFCRILHIPVENAQYLSFTLSSGHVEHEPVAKAGKSFWFTVFPGLLNCIIGLPMFAVGFTSLIVFSHSYTSSNWLFFVYLLLLYFGLSCLCNLFPFYEDALDTWDLVIRGKTNIVVKILAFLPALCLRIGAFLESKGITLLLLLALIAVGIFV